MAVLDTIAETPKVELHVHLEGCASPEFVYAASQRNGVPLPAANLEDWKSRYRFTGLNHFIELYVAAAKALARPDDFYELTVDLMQRQARAGVVYTEAFLSASLLVGRLPGDEVLDALARAVADHAEELGTTVTFIPDVARHMPNTSQWVLDFVKEGQKKGIVIGLGIGGPERGFSTRAFTDMFADARAAGLHVVAHAGEDSGPQDVEEALEYLGAERIGHGIGVVGSPELMRQLAQDGTPFEVCPTCNYRLNVVPQDRPHPIRAMYEAGLNCTVNSDDPAIIGTTLLDDYALLGEQGFDQGQLEQMIDNGWNAAFIDDSRRAQLKAAADGRDRDRERERGRER
ncbi:MAG TPA: adenosine deaminase [Longimicrobiales bacterium]|nr:adenosine deaminase [Longimicrobiales bacterium]